jgi:acyl-CoA thioester hydrolase
MKNRKLNFKREDFKIKLVIPVRFRDTDMMSHVNNAVYMTYFEQSRFHYLKELGFDFIKNQKDFSFILAEIRCRFLDPALYGEIIYVHIRISNIKRSQFEFEYLITCEKDSRTIAMAHSIQVVFDWEKHKLGRIPENLKEKIEKLEGKKF